MAPGGAAGQRAGSADHPAGSAGLDPRDLAVPRRFVTRQGVPHRLPAFLPVHQPQYGPGWLAGWEGGPAVDGCIVNAYFLYKRREVARRLTEQISLREYVGCAGLIATDSGAFQGFSRPLYLRNRDIVRFQDRIGSDVVAPLDLVTPPKDRRATAQAKLEATHKRVREALPLTQRGILAGVQQGGRFLELRHTSAGFLRDLGVGYVALGSLVPFFNRNHDLRFVATVARDARSVVGGAVPIHLYGAGDPCELPFLVASGVSVFDSASYGHYAKGGWYMTRYGAIRDPGPVRAGEYRCGCPVCQRHPEHLPTGDDLVAHNLWTICRTMDEIHDRLDAGTLEDHLGHILEVHRSWFPDSMLESSWRALRG